MFPYTRDGYEIRMHHHGPWIILEAVPLRQNSPDQIPVRWAAAMLHEVRTPLATLSGYLDMMDPQIAGESGKQRLERAKAQIDRLSHLTSDLMWLFKRNIAKEWCDINTLVDCAWASIRAKGSASTLTRIEPPHARVYANPRRFELILVNMFKNAVEAVPSGEPILIRVHIQHGENFHSVAVIDDGPGIPEDVLTTLWDEPRTTKVQGHGLGLWIVKHLVDAHGGRLRLATHPRNGTTLTIVLPYDAPSPIPGSNPTEP